MITPDELQTATDDDKKAIAEFENRIEKALKESPYFGIELTYGDVVLGHQPPPARIWLHVLNRYIEADWIVDPRPDIRLFSPPRFNERDQKWPIFTIRAKTHEEVLAIAKQSAKK